MTYSVKHISVSINRSVSDVYEFVSNPENLPKWAKGLSNSIAKNGDHWITYSPMGEVKVKFADKNQFGIVDHYVILPSGEEVYNPMRVFENNKGSEVLFTLYRLSNRSEDQYRADGELVARDLRSLKDILEK